MITSLKNYLSFLSVNIVCPSVEQERKVCYLVILYKNQVALFYPIRHCHFSDFDQQSWVLVNHVKVEFLYDCLCRYFVKVARFIEITGFQSMIHLNPEADSLLGM